MTAVIQDATAGEASAGEAAGPAVLIEGAEDPLLPGPAGGGRPVISVVLLAAHPGNVRRNTALDEEFIASVRELGILTPLRVTPDGDGYRVIEGYALPVTVRSYAGATARAISWMFLADGNPAGCSPSTVTVSASGASSPSRDGSGRRP